MSARTRTFMQAWSNQSAPLGRAMTGINPTAAAMLAELLAEASFVGISRQDIEDEVGDVGSFVALRTGHQRVIAPLQPNKHEGRALAPQTNKLTEGR